jgi:hypothetical protein
VNTHTHTHTHTISHNGTESQAVPILHSVTQPRQTYKGAPTIRQSLTLEVTCLRNIRQLWAHKHDPTHKIRSEPTDHRQGHARTQVRHIPLQTHPHPAGDPPSLGRATHPQPPTIYTQPRATHRDDHKASCAGHTRAQLNTQAHPGSRRDWGGGSPSHPLPFTSPTWSHQPTSQGLEQVSQKKSTRGILKT